VARWRDQVPSRLPPGSLPVAGADQARNAVFGDYAKHGSLLFGDLGTALVIMRLAPSLAVAEIVHARVNANMELPVRELMWGLPGSMLACIHMAEMADAARWRGTFEAQAKRLLDDLQDTTGSPIWTQDLYGAALSNVSNPPRPR
jgi:hypothetical protein